MRIFKLILTLFAILLWTHSFTQNTSGQKVIDLEGNLGVFVPESEYRVLREDQKKGFTHYTNWEITEVQLVRCDSINLKFTKEIKLLKIDAKADLEAFNVLTLSADQCHTDLTDLVDENAVLRTKVKLLPWLTVGAFIIGAVVGVVASK